MVAGIIASVNGQLSWYNANAVSYLVWQVTLCLICLLWPMLTPMLPGRIGNLAMYFVYMAADFAQRKHKLRDRLLLWLFIFDYVAASGLTIYMWCVTSVSRPVSEGSHLLTGLRRLSSDPTQILAAYSISTTTLCFGTFLRCILMLPAVSQMAYTHASLLA